jgi:hypothetical protein
LAFNAFPFSGLVARGRASLSLPWVSTASGHVWPPSFLSIDQQEEKIEQNIQLFPRCVCGEEKKLLASLPLGHVLYLVPTENTCRLLLKGSQLFFIGLKDRS